MGDTPTSRSLRECKKLGWLAYVTEKWVPGMNVRRDAFGFGDILALDGQPGSLLIQATAGSGVSARANKIKTECRDAAMAWLKAGNRIEVWGWAKQGPAGKRKLWTLRRVPVVIKEKA